MDVDDATTVNDGLTQPGNTDDNVAQLNAEKVENNNENSEQPGGSAVPSITDSSAEQSTVDVVAKAASVSERLLIPFQNGWGREIVFRHPTEEVKGKKAVCDVYYFTPEGNKLRSIPEVERYLQAHPDSDLATDCFSYRRERIYKEPEEIVRLAGKVKSKSSFSPGASTSSSLSNTPSAKRPRDSLGESPLEKRKSVKPAKLRCIELSPPREKKKSSRRSSQAASATTLSEAPAELADGSDGTLTVKQELPTSPMATDDTADGEYAAASVEGTAGDLLVGAKSASPRKKVKKKPTLKSLLGVVRKSTTPKAGHSSRKKAKVSESSAVGDFSSVADVSLDGGLGELDTSISLDTSSAVASGKKSSAEGSTSKQRTIKIVRMPPKTPCNLTCAGQDGKPPHLQCARCKCMFHASCAGLPETESADQTKSLVCKWCVAKQKLKEERARAKKERRESENVPPASAGVPSNQPSGTSIASTSSAAAPALALSPHRAATSSSHHTVSTPRQLAPPPSHIPGGVSTAVPLGLQPWLTDGASAGHLTTANENIPRSVTPSMEKAHVKAISSSLSSLTASASNKSSNAPASGQMLKLPASVLRVLDTRKKISLVFNDGKTITVDPENLRCGGGGVRIALPANSLPPSLISPGTGTTFNIHVDKTNPDLQVLSVRHVNKVSGQRASQSPTSMSQIDFKSSASEACHFARLLHSFNGMLDIFQYLSLKDLLRVSCVSRAWRKMAASVAMWHAVRLQGLRIVDWSAAATLFQEHGTVSLDLSGMLVDGHTWMDFVEAMDTLTSIIRLELCACPPHVIHDACARMGQLRSLVAKSIANGDVAAIDPSRVAALKHLQQLKLRGTNGFTIVPGTSLNSLASLSRLTVLSLTSLIGMGAEQFTFLASLTELVTLEIGDVHLWTPETYAALLALTKLKRLRLEGSNTTLTSDHGLSATLKTLTRLERLELIHYAISDTLADSLPLIGQLNHLCVWPDSVNQDAVTNSRVVKAVSAMTSLRSVEWGIRCAAAMNSEDVDVDTVALMAADSDEAESVSLKTVQERLQTHLPHTKIIVFKVPELVRHSGNSS